MNKFFKKLPLLAKLMLIGIIPFCCLVYLTVQVYEQKTQKLELFDSYKTYIAESDNISKLNEALQDERKYSFDFAMTKSMQKELWAMRPRTDSLIRTLLSKHNPALVGITRFTKLGELSDIRKKVDAFEIGPDAVMHFYTNLIFRLNTLNTLPPANTAYLQPVYKHLMVQKILSEMQTYLSIIRSNIYNVLHTKKYMVETMIGTIGTHDVYNSYESELLAKGTPDILRQYQYTRNKTALKPTLDYIDGLFKRFSFDDTYTAVQWWKLSDKGVHDLQKLQNQVGEDLNAKIDMLHNDERKSRDMTFLFLILALVSVGIVLAYIVFIINQTLKELRLAAEKIANGETGLTIEADSNDVVGRLAKSILKIDRNHHALANATKEIGKENFDVIIEPRSENDILANAIIHMKNELQQYSEKMEELVGQRTLELARSNDDLQQFAHVASHDLKEPLRKISIFSDYLNNEHAALSEKGKGYLDKIQHASTRMSDMIEGILTYSTVAVNEQFFERVDLNHIISEIENDLELVILQKKAQINYTSLPAISGIELLLHQLFYNLINNAIKFSKTEVAPVITVTSKLEPSLKLGRHNGKPRNFVHITIADNGIGFNQDFAEKMFSVFSRLNSKDAYEGTGLGLALCRKIVYRHHGEIYAEGEEGKGARFHILLPADILKAP